MDISITINRRAYQNLHKSKTFPNITPIATIKATADTGAQTCTSGVQILTALPQGARWLLPTKHRLRGVDGTMLDIKGTLIVDISSGRGTTTELLYVCDKVSGTYLSQTALKRLGIINNTFPISEVSNLTTTPTPALAQCGCPLRAKCPPIPEKLPFPATDEHRKDLEHWIKTHYASSAFNTCPHQKLQTMTGEPLNIAFLPEHIPTAVHKPIPIPHHWKDKVKTQLDTDVALGIIEPVPQGTPTKWCSRMIVVPKKDGSPRRTVDLQSLNKATRRETHHTQTPFNIVSVVPPEKKKTILDAWNGYHSVLLSPNARDATTFITEWGRYRYLRAPQGFHASNDGYTKRFDDITADFPRVARCVDDSLLWDDGIATAYWHTVSYIKLCADNGVVFNPEKFKFAEDHIEFAGFDITLQGYKPPSKILQAIEEFPTPKNITGIRSWFGLVNQVAYAFAQAPVMAPFRELLERSKPFYWDDSLDTIFRESKTKIVESIQSGIKTFEVNRPTCLATDWSKSGLGFTLSQKHCHCPNNEDPLCGPDHWKVVYAGSRFTRDSESRYAPIEGEALALLFGLESCKMFVSGCPYLIVAVDHKPLVPIFNDRDLDKIQNPRVQKFREKTLGYTFKVVAIPGSKNHGPDAASRIPLPTVDSKETNIGYIEDSMTAAIANRELSNDIIKLSTIREHGHKDTQYWDLINMIQQGFPDRKSLLPNHLHEFWTMRNDLYTNNYTIFIAGRPLIPKSLRRPLLDQLHIGHQGVAAVKANARQRFFWPGMNNDIQSVRNNCQRCNEIAPSQSKEPLRESSDPDHPFQRVVADLFHMAGRKYQIYADRFSGWTEVASASNFNATTTSKILQNYFVTFGVPEELSTDGGPPYDSHEFTKFLEQWGVRLRRSSAYYPQSNGRAESAVKSMKRILTTNISQSGSLETEGVAKALLLHRNTPPPDMGISPAELLFGRNISDHLPKPIRFRKEWSELADARETAYRRRQLHAAAKYASPKDHYPLDTGQTVSIQNQTGHHHTHWDKTGRIVETLPNRQYRVLIDGSRRTTLRNRRFLRQIKDNTRKFTDEDSITDVILPQNTPLIPTSADEQHQSLVALPSEETCMNNHHQSSDILSKGETAADIATRPSRPIRTTRLPAKFKDYVMN